MIHDLPLWQAAKPLSKLAIQWEKCKKKNPSLINDLAQLALELKSYGHTRYSMDGLFHILRWESRTSTSDMGLKINNNYTSFAARDVMDQYPDLKGFFQLREQKPKGNWGQIS